MLSKLPGGWVKPKLEVSPPAAPDSRWFADAGLAVMRSPSAHVIVDAGAFGSGSGGHSHADTLSIVAFRDGSELLIDPGTFTYIADPAARERFRGTAAHNTVGIDGVEQAEARGPFRWESPPDVRLLYWKSDECRDVLDASCRYRGFTHRRSIVFRKPDALVVVDRIDGLAGEHTVEQRWLGPDDKPDDNNGDFLATLPVPLSEEPAERSRAFGSTEPARRYVARWRGTLPVTLAALVSFSTAPKLRSVHESGGAILVEFEGGSARFPKDGPPESTT